MAEKYTLIKVSNGKRKVFDYRWELRDMDFDFEKKAYGKSYYYKKYQLQDKDGINEIKAFCKKHKLAFDQVSSDYIRSDDYRKSFFHHNKGIGHGKYLCAYCGKIKKKDVITVDHIFPLKKTESNKKIQLIAKWFFGITNLNAYKNLCAACWDCNSKKGSKTGIWIIRGFLGKSNIIWFIRKTLRLLFLFTAILILLIFLYNHGFIPKRNF